VAVNISQSFLVQPGGKGPSRSPRPSFSSLSEAILKGQLQVTQPGRSIPDDGTGWIWLDKILNDFTPTAVAIAKHLHAPPKDPEIVLGSEDRRQIPQRGVDLFSVVCEPTHT
jgi:hypothetical protein